MPASMANANVVICSFTITPAFPNFLTTQKEGENGMSFDFSNVLSMLVLQCRQPLCGLILRLVRAFDVSLMSIRGIHSPWSIMSGSSAYICVGNLN